MGVDVIARVFILLKNWKTLLTAESISFKFKVVYFFSLLTTLPFKKYVFWLGDRFYVDGRLAALLLPSYLDEIKYLLSEAPDDQNNFFILDVGANIGQFAYNFLYFKPDSIIISVEPNTKIIPLLEKNLTRFGERWKLLKVAVGPTTKKSNFYFVEGKSSQGSLIEANSNFNLLKQNPVVSLEINEVPLTSETFLAETGLTINKFYLIKIDVEGYEKRALQGLLGLKTKYCWVETIKDRSGGLGFTEAALLVKESFGELSGSEQNGSNSLFRF